jgi:hypothetical protein
VCRERFLPKAVVSLPGTGTVCTEITGVTAFHQPGGPAGNYFVVVIVLPEIAIRIRYHFVRIPEVMSYYFQTLSIRLNAQSKSAYPNTAVITFHIAVVLRIIRRTAGIDAAGPQGPSAFIRYHMRPCIACVEIPVAIRACIYGMQ